MSKKGRMQPARRFTLRVALAVVAVGLAAWWTFTVVTAGPTPSTSLYNGVDQVALQRCLAQNPPVNCESVVPGLAQCMQQGLSCNQAADAYRNANFGPARPVTDFGVPMTQAEAVAESLGTNPPTTPTVAREMTYGEFLTLSGLGPVGGISLSRVVWVVTVHGSLPAATGGPYVPGKVPPKDLSLYTVIIDAASKQVISVVGSALLG